MFEMHYFSDKFSNVVKRWELLVPTHFKPFMVMTWSCVIWPNRDFSNWSWRNRN